MSDDLARFRREFAAMNELLADVPDHPVTVEDLEKVGQVRRFFREERATLTDSAALATADLYYLKNYTQTRIGDLLAISNVAVSKHLATRWPQEYLAVRRAGGDTYEVERVKVAPDRGGTSYETLRRMQEQGWRVAPAVLRVDPDTVDPAELWEQLGTR